MILSKIKPFLLGYVRSRCVFEPLKIMVKLGYCSFKEHEIEIRSPDQKLIYNFEEIGCNIIECGCRYVLNFVYLQSTVIHVPCNSIYKQVSTWTSENKSKCKGRVSLWATPKLLFVLCRLLFFNSVWVLKCHLPILLK